MTKQRLEELKQWLIDLKNDVLFAFDDENDDYPCSSVPELIALVEKQQAQIDELVVALADLKDATSKILMIKNELTIGIAEINISQAEEILVKHKSEESG